ncbi:MAG TPA: M13 family metallopeptidase [Bryobacteraceae bacterium]|nr:M13 family metallopeptidase [Bryobacteraceae bacterium]
MSPCTDFYQYACGNWLASNPTPADQPSYGRFAELADRNRRTLKDILETSSAKTERTPVEQKIGDYYAACMDEKTIDAKGIAPVKSEWARIDDVKSKAGLVDTIAHLQEIGANVFFTSGADEDFKDSSKIIAQFDQGGMSLPEREYYFRTDPKSEDLRKKFVAHVARMFELAGVPKDKAAANAATVIRIETELAKGALDRVSRRDPSKVYHVMTITQLDELSPEFSYKRYFELVGAPNFEKLNVGVPEFAKQMSKTIESNSLDDIKTYLKWQYLNSAAPVLPEPFVNENFNFFRRDLLGAKQIRPRWTRCVIATDSALGEALGQKYVEMTFGAEGKQRTLDLVKNLVAAMSTDIEKIDWMTPTTKKRALEKLHAIANKIGYPDKWRDYTTLKVEPKDALGNAERASEFEFKRQLNRIGKPKDPNEWGMTPPTVNAYYHPLQNNINFPAGILQPPFFETSMDDAVNYGGIGAVIGHELTHGFDDQGRQFDAHGNLKDWWTEEDAREFSKRTECFVNQYGSYVADGDVKQNGKLTLGENVADNGGLRLAHMALMKALANKPAQKKDGFTPEQRFFLGFAQIWCTNATPQFQRMQAQTDPHSLPKYRVNGTVSNMPEFQKAFSCTQGQPMVREPACRVW